MAQYHLISHIPHSNARLPSIDPIPHQARTTTSEQTRADQTRPPKISIFIQCTPDHAHRIPPIRVRVMTPLLKHAHAWCGVGVSQAGKGDGFSIFYLYISRLADSCYYEYVGGPSYGVETSWEFMVRRRRLGWSNGGAMRHEW